MADGAGGRVRVLGYLLVVVSIVTLLGIAGCDGKQGVDEEQLKAQLRGSPVPSAILTAIAAATSEASVSASVRVTPTSTPAPSVPSPAPTAAAITSPGPAGVTPIPALLPATTQTSEPVGPPVRIVFSDLQIDAPVVEMSWQVVQTSQGSQSEWIIPENAAGHHINSALLGEAGNIVLSAHNNIYGKVFGPISWAWVNDGIVQVDAATDRSSVLDGRIIQLYAADGREFDFVVTYFYRLRDTGVSLNQRIDNARYMQPTPAGQLTLITCWPPNSNTHRLVVVAQPVGR